MPVDTTIKFKAINIAVITVSDTRDELSDSSGKLLVDLIENSGHIVKNKSIVKDEADLITNQIKSIVASGEIDAIITTGGTGVTGRDVTPEALECLCDKIIPGFGELFRMLSYQKIGTSTIQSRATAGVYKGVYIFALPGSKGAVKDAWNDILQYQLDIRHKPCNFIEIMSRLNEN